MTYKLHDGVAALIQRHKDAGAKDTETVRVLREVFKCGMQEAWHYIETWEDEQRLVRMEKRLEDLERENTFLENRIKELEVDVNQLERGTHG